MYECDLCLLYSMSIWLECTCITSLLVMRSYPLVPPRLIDYVAYVYIYIYLSYKYTIIVYTICDNIGVYELIPAVSSFDDDEMSR